MPKTGFSPDRNVRSCGSDCTCCETYERFVMDDEKWLVNSETGYRCCWLPKDYPRGAKCEIAACCEDKGLEYCGECPQFQDCARMKQFYSTPNYDALRKDMIEILKERRAAEKP